MKHLNSLLAGLAVVALASCTNDEPAPDGPIMPEGDKAYLNITICPTEDGGISRADGDEGYPTFVDGEEAENDVVSADFFFYDAKGNYVLRANVWTGGTENPGDNHNIEYFGNNVVVLEGLTGKGYPNWVVTVLNAPEGFEPGNTLDEMGKIVLDNKYDANHKLTHAAYLNESGKFIMTTSSHFCSDNKVSDNKWNYFATQLKESNFYQETPDKVNFQDKDRVTIYVERLAARVGVEVKIANGTQEILNIGNRTLYRVDASVSGNPNDDISGDNPTGVGATKLYVEITGWDLITTARATNVMKDLSGWSTSTKFGDTDWIWNRGSSTPAYHRSYWGKSTTYGFSGDPLAVRLDQRKTYDELTNIPNNKIFNGDRAYCNECTNIPENITDNGLATGVIDATKTTAVVLQAVVCDEKGNPVSLVNFQGLNYERSSFLNKVLANTTRLYTRVSKGTTTTTGEELYDYLPLTADDVTLAAAGEGTGTVKVVVIDDTKEYYSINENDFVTKEVEVETEDGKVTESIKIYNATLVSDPNAVLARITENNKAVAYTDGACYYPIAIAHLNENENTESKEIIEGQYGVVRNHIYNVRITKIKTLGHGVFQPYPVGDESAEQIIPDPKDPTYYVESKVNILSWRVVTQEEEI